MSRAHILYVSKAVKLQMFFFLQQLFCSPQRNFCAGVFLMHCCDTEVPAVLFIFYHNDKLQFVLLYFTALRSISTMQWDNDPAISSLGASYNKKQFLVVGTTEVSTLLLHTHTHTQTHDSAIKLRSQSASCELRVILKCCHGAFSFL